MRVELLVLGAHSLDGCLMQEVSAVYWNASNPFSTLTTISFSLLCCIVRFLASAFNYDRFGGCGNKLLWWIYEEGGGRFNDGVAENLIYSIYIVHFHKKNSMWWLHAIQPNNSIQIVMLKILLKPKLSLKYLKHQNLYLKKMQAEVN